MLFAFETHSRKPMQMQSKLLEWEDARVQNSNFKDISISINKQNYLDTVYWSQYYTVDGKANSITHISAELDNLWKAFWFCLLFLQCHCRGNNAIIEF